MLAAFQPSSTGISCDSFNQVVENHMSTLLRGCFQVLVPLLWIDSRPGEGFQSVDAMRIFLRDALPQSPQRVLPSSASILNPPILSQLDMILPVDCILQNISVSWSARGDQIDLKNLKDQIPVQSPVILLVSGRKHNQHVIFGPFNPKESTEERGGYIKPLMFQLAPFHRAFCPSSIKAEGSIWFGSVGGSTVMTSQLISFDRANENPTTGELEFQQDSIILLMVCGNSGHFTVQSDPTIDEHFHVDAVELLKFDVEDTGESDSEEE